MDDLQGRRADENIRDRAVAARAHHDAGASRLHRFFHDGPRQWRQAAGLDQDPDPVLGAAQVPGPYPLPDPEEFLPVDLVGLRLAGRALARLLGLGAQESRGRSSNRRRLMAPSSSTTG